MDEYEKMGGYAKDKALGMNIVNGGGTPAGAQTFGMPQAQQSSFTPYSASTIKLSDPLKAAQTNVDTRPNLPTFQAGQTVDTSGYKNAIEKYNPGDPKFNMGQLSDSINGAKTSAGAVPVQAYQYQDPAQFQKLLT
jgi:hypothetical protein